MWRPSASSSASAARSFLRYTFSTRQETSFARLYIVRPTTDAPVKLDPPVFQPQVRN